MAIRNLALPLACSVGALVLGWVARGWTDVRVFPAPVHVPVSTAPPDQTKPLPDVTPSSERWEDHTHVVLVLHRPDMHWEDAYHLGSSPDRDNPEITVTVKSTVGRGVPSVAEIDRWTGFDRVVVTLQFDPVTKRVEARVESRGDAYPQPPPQWEDVSGFIWASDMEWGLGRSVILDYSLYGVRGGSRQCAHGKVSVDL
jgi:hypothetical protein